MSNKKTPEKTSSKPSGKGFSSGFIKGACWALVILGVLGAAFYWAGGFQALPQIKQRIQHTLPRFNTPTPQEATHLVIDLEKIEKAEGLPEEMPVDNGPPPPGPKLEQLAEQAAQIEQAAALPAKPLSLEDKNIAKDLAALKQHLNTLQLELVTQLQQQQSALKAQQAVKTAPHTDLLFTQSLAQLAMAQTNGEGINIIIDTLYATAPKAYKPAVQTLAENLNQPFITQGVLLIAVEDLTFGETESSPNEGWWHRFFKIEKLAEDGTTMADRIHSKQTALSSAIKNQNWEKAHALAPATFSAQLKAYQAQQQALKTFWKTLATGGVEPKGDGA
jgi:hypothetical protein